MELADLLDDSTAAATVAYLKRTTSGDKCPCCCVRKYEYITHVFVKFGYGGCDYYPLTSVTDTGTLKIGDDGWACGDLSEIDLSSFNLCEPMFHSHIIVSVTTDSDSQSSSCIDSDDIEVNPVTGSITARKFCLSESCLPPCNHTVKIEENIYLTVILKFATDSNIYAAPCGEEDCGHGSHVGGSPSKVAAIRSDEVRYIPYGEPGSSGFLQAMIPVSVKCPEDLGLEGTYVLCKECLIWPNGPIYDCHVTSESGSYTKVSFQETEWHNNFSCDNVNYARLYAFYRRTDCPPASSSDPERCDVRYTITTDVYMLFADNESIKIKSIESFGTLPVSEISGERDITIPSISLSSLGICGGLVDHIDTDCTNVSCTTPSLEDGTLSEHLFSISTEVLDCNSGSFSCKESIYISAYVDISYELTEEIQNCYNPIERKYDDISKYGPCSWTTTYSTKSMGLAHGYVYINIDRYCVSDGVPLIPCDDVFYIHSIGGHTYEGYGQFTVPLELMNYCDMSVKVVVVCTHDTTIDISYIPDIELKVSKKAGDDVGSNQNQVSVKNGPWCPIYVDGVIRVTVSSGMYVGGDTKFGGFGVSCDETEISHTEEIPFKEVKVSAGEEITTQAFIFGPVDYEGEATITVDITDWQ